MTVEPITLYNTITLTRREAGTMNLISRKCFFVLVMIGLSAGVVMSSEQQIIHPEARIVNEQSGVGSLLSGNDILVSDMEEYEFYSDMVSSATEYFLVVEYYSPSTTINVFRSSDGGNSWWHYAGFTGGDYKIMTPALAVPEVDEDYLYIIYEYANQIQVARIDLGTGAIDYYNVEANSNGVHHPRITTDNICYPGNPWLYVTYSSYDGSTFNVKAARSVDDAETWVLYHILQRDGAYIQYPDISFGNYNLYLVSDSLHYTGELEVRVRRSTDLGFSWEPYQNLTTVSTNACIYPRVAASQSTGTVVVAYEDYEIGVNEDVYYAYSTDGGVNWNGNNCLACTSENNEGWPDITIDPSYGDFHATYRFNDWVDTFNSMYSHAAQSTPWSWSAPEAVNDVPYAYNDYQRPVAVDWASGGAGIAWIDTRTETQAVFFDRVDFVTPYPLQIGIYPYNGTVFHPGDYIYYGVYLINHSPYPVQTSAAVYASNNALWRLNLFGPFNFNMPADTMYGPLIRYAQVPWGVPPMTAYICAEANEVHDCYQVTIE